MATPNGTTALWFAAEEGNLDIVRYLAEKVDDLNPVENVSRTSALDQAGLLNHNATANILSSRINKIEKATEKLRSLGDDVPLNNAKSIEALRDYITHKNQYKGLEQETLDKINSYIHDNDIIFSNTAKNPSTQQDFSFAKLPPGLGVLIATFNNLATYHAEIELAGQSDAEEVGFVA